MSALHAAAAWFSAARVNRGVRLAFSIAFLLGGLVQILRFLHGMFGILTDYALWPFLSGHWPEYYTGFTGSVLMLLAWGVFPYAKRETAVEAADIPATSVPAALTSAGPGVVGNQWKRCAAAAFVFFAGLLQLTILPGEIGGVDSFGGWRGAAPDVPWWSHFDPTALITLWIAWLILPWCKPPPRPRLEGEPAPLTVTFGLDESEWRREAAPSGEPECVAVRAILLLLSTAFAAAAGIAASGSMDSNSVFGYEPLIRQCIVTPLLAWLAWLLWPWRKRWLGK